MWKRKNYRVKKGMLLLEDVTSRIDPVKLINSITLVFIGVVLGIIGCYLIR